MKKLIIVIENGKIVSVFSQNATDVTIALVDINDGMQPRLTMFSPDYASDVEQAIDELMDTQEEGEE